MRIGNFEVIKKTPSTTSYTNTNLGYVVIDRTARQVVFSAPTLGAARVWIADKAA
jgi:hypothetical protein